MMTAEEARLLQRSPLRIEQFLIQIEEEIEYHCMTADTGYIFHKILDVEQIHLQAIMKALERLGFGVVIQEGDLKIDWFKKW